MYVLQSVEPFHIFKHFEEISRIPRGSGNEKAVADFISNFAAGLGLFVHRDKFNNLVIRKPAGRTHTSSETVIIQGHMDMVNEKNKASLHNFDKDPLDIYVDGDLIKARGTTLGADNGIAVAMAMSLMEGDYDLPPLEFVLTSDEEAGMSGAAGLSSELLIGRKLINIDTEEEGYFVASCAGGHGTLVALPIKYSSLDKNKTSLLLFVSGLKGGHSGIDISKERGNANRIIGRVLNILTEEFDISISRISGGSKGNAIPREAEALIHAKPENVGAIREKLSEITAILKKEYRSTDCGIALSLEEINEKAESVFSKETLENIIFALMTIPIGIQNMSSDFPGLVETSNNLGIVRTENGFVNFSTSTRSSVISRKYAVADQIKLIAQKMGADFTVIGGYPAWEFNPKSALRDTFCDTYKEMYGKEPVIMAIHAGLECGLFAEKAEGIDIISFGPDMWDVHTPDEKLSISSTARSFEFLLHVLKKL